MTAKPTRSFVLGLVAAVMLTIGVYWAGLAGGYVHDDYSFIVNNDDVHVDTPDLGAWVRAAESFPARHQGRWLTMLSFAGNYYLTGLNPFWMKATNLGIHIINGILIALMLRALFALSAKVRDDDEEASPHASQVALAIAACWLVLPINLTGVLYVSQRLESLSQLFVLLGLWLYLRGRLCMLRGQCGVWAIAVPLTLCTAIGLLAKESAVLLPVYTACVEVVIVGLRDRSGARHRSVVALYGALLLLPLLAGLAWLASWVGGVSSYARPFTTVERLLTESRVLVDYIQWTLLPTSKVLTLYHDDIAISHGLLDPPSTLFSLVALAALLTVAILQRRKRPLFCLGILWFFAAHLLTATVIPLELAYEHRNYFASCGLLLAIGSLLALDPASRLRPRVAACIAAAALVFFAFSTSIRALEWGNPVSLAIAESRMNPESPRATYELGRTYVVLSGFRADSPFVPRAYEALERAAALPGSDTLADQGLLILASRTGTTIDSAWWTHVQAKLRNGPLTSQDVTSLYALTQCSISRKCTFAPEQVIACFSAALTHPRNASEILSIYASYAVNVLGDRTLALDLVRESIERSPHDLQLRKNLVTLLIADGQKTEAQAALDEAVREFGPAAHDPQVADLARQIRSIGSQPPPAATGESHP